MWLASVSNATTRILFYIFWSFPSWSRRFTTGGSDSPMAMRRHHPIRPIPLRSRHGTLRATDLQELQSKGLNLCEDPVEGGLVAERASEKGVAAIGACLESGKARSSLSLSTPRIRIGSWSVHRVRPWGQPRHWSDERPSTGSDERLPEPTRRWVSYRPDRADGPSSPSPRARSTASVRRARRASRRGDACASSPCSSTGTARSRSRGRTGCWAGSGALGSRFR